MKAAYENLSKFALLTLAKEQSFIIAKLEIELAEIKRLVFGVKSERFVPDNNPMQSELDFGLELLKQPEIRTEQISYDRRVGKKQTPHGRGFFPEHLPRKDHIIEPDEDVTGLKKIGEEITRELEYKPPTFYVNRYIRPKYARPNDEGVIIGILPSRPIEKGAFGPGFLSHIILSKCIDHLPLYRQCQQYLRHDIKIPASTLCDAFSGSCRALEPLFKLHKELTLNVNYLQVDETPMKVLDRNLKGKTHLGQMWAYYDPVNKQAFFDYQEGRSQHGPGKLLQYFQGMLQVDGYGVYPALAKRLPITLLCCMAHARRYFEKALNTDREQAQYAMTEIQKLYAIEREAREEKLTPEARRELRIQRAKPILDAFEKWMKTQLTAPGFRPKSKISAAIGYTLNHWPALLNYLEDGRYEIDNNLVENSIRPIALGRKNYLFAGSHDGARRLAMIYSFAATAKLNGVEPFAWMKDTLTRISDHPYKNLADLLPQNWRPGSDTELTVKV